MVPLKPFKRKEEYLYLETGLRHYFRCLSRDGESKFLCGSIFKGREVFVNRRSTFQMEIEVLGLSRTRR